MSVSSASPSTVRHLAALAAGLEEINCVEQRSLQSTKLQLNESLWRDGTVHYEIHLPFFYNTNNFVLQLCVFAKEYECFETNPPLRPFKDYQSRVDTNSKFFTKRRSRSLVQAGLLNTVCVKQKVPKAQIFHSNLY